MKRLISGNEFYAYLSADLLVFTQIAVFLLSFHYGRPAYSVILPRFSDDVFIFVNGRIWFQLILYLAIFVLVPLAFWVSHTNRNHPNRPEGNKRFFIICSKVFLIPAWLFTAFFLGVSVLLIIGGGPG
jgi:hypothetical protein